MPISFVPKVLDTYANAKLKKLPFVPKVLDSANDIINKVEIDNQLIVGNILRMHKLYSRKTNINLKIINKNLKLI